MTTTTTPAPILTMPAEQRACGICCVPVGPDDAQRLGIERLRCQGRELAPSHPLLGIDSESAHAQIAAGALEVEVTRCPPCAAVRARAEQAVQAHPAGRGRYGSTEQAVEMTEAALAALCAVGEPTGPTSTRELRLLLELVAPTGRAALWRSRFEPIAQHDARANTAARRPFAHLSDDTRTTLEAAVLKWRVRRAERPVELLPPVGAGCYLCGIATVHSLPSRRAEAWHVERMSGASFGVRSSDAREAAICGVCAVERHEGEPLGRVYFDRLVLRAAGVYGRLGSERVVTRALPWGELPERMPNTEPFAHLALDDLRNRFEVGLLS